MTPKRAAVPVAILIVALASGAAFAQGVGINATGAAADTSALLDLSSTAKGFLAPRMTLVQRGAIVLPATGLVVYQTDGATGLYWNAGTPAAPNWKQVADAAAGAGGQWSVSGADLYYSDGRVGVGTAAPTHRLEVVDDNLGLRVQTNLAGSTLASFGGFGAIRVDAPGIAGGRLTLLESGRLGLGRTAPLSRLDVLGGNGDVVNGEGDFRIGDGSYRLKMGITTTGGGAGAATIMEQGTPGAYNVLALGSQGNKVLYVNGNTQRIGIGTDQPNAPLGFPPSLGKKITLYPGATGDVGIGVAGNRLQLYADNPNADVALGYDQAGVFNERFAVKPTGALAVNGNAGAAGQVLQSNGEGAAATWVSPTNAAFANLYQVVSTTAVAVAPLSPSQPVPGLSQTFTVAGNARVLVSTFVPFNFQYCALCPSSGFNFEIVTDGVVTNLYPVRAENSWIHNFSTTLLVEVGPGTHNIQIRAQSNPTYTLNAGGFSLPTKLGTLTLQVIPQ